eukprot:Skav212986  [mRNA]  locus=scaffold423:172116:177080:- [translate_table: standard]
MQRQTAQDSMALRHGDGTALLDTLPESEKKKPHEALKRLQRVKVAMADPDAVGQTPWYRFPVNEPRRQRTASHSAGIGQRTEIFLSHGALFQLGAKTNSSYYHAVKQTAGAVGPRVSVTFRRVLTYKTASGDLIGQGATYPTLNWPIELNGQHRFDDALDESLPTASVASVAPAPPPQTGAKREQRQLQPSDVKFLKDLLEEAKLEEFFEKGDLRSAGTLQVAFLKPSTDGCSMDLQGMIAFQRAEDAEKIGLAAQELLKGKGIGEAFNKWKSQKAPKKPKEVRLGLLICPSTPKETATESEREREKKRECREEKARVEARERAVASRGHYQSNVKAKRRGHRGSHHAKLLVIPRKVGAVCAMVLSEAARRDTARDPSAA